VEIVEEQKIYKEFVMRNTTLVRESPEARTTERPKLRGSSGLPLPLRRVETFDIADQDCAEETYQHWSSLPTFLEAKMYLCPIAEIITVTAASKLKPCLRGHFWARDAAIFSEVNICSSVKKALC
jgi:hypothetical protein